MGISKRDIFVHVIAILLIAAAIMAVVTVVVVIVERLFTIAKNTNAILKDTKEIKTLLLDIKKALDKTDGGRQ